MAKDRNAFLNGDSANLPLKKLVSSLSFGAIFTILPVVLKGINVYAKKRLVLERQPSFSLRILPATASRKNPLMEMRGDA
jgi:hypothetical protein